MEAKAIQRRKYQRNIQLILVILILIVLNLISSGYFRRIDLTSEKRYSLSDLTLETVSNLNSLVYVKVYLEGDFPPNIRKYQEMIRTTLSEMRQYSYSNLEFDFIDPARNKELMADLEKRGYYPIPVRQQGLAEKTEKKMYPVVSLKYQKKEIFVDLLKGCAYPGGEINFQKAEADLEYKLMSAIRTLIREKSGIVAFMQGHGEYPLEQLGELVTELQNAYSVFSYDMSVKPGDAISPSIDVLVIAQPTKRFSERDKYEIDQYLMRGGRIMWIMGQELVDMDMYDKRSCLTQLQEVNLDDMFMKYGFKIRYDLIQDLLCDKTEVVQSTPSGMQFDSKPWHFFPMLLKLPEHPLNRNIDLILHRYASGIDTFARNGVLTRVFLETSPASRTIQGQQFIDVNEYVQSPPPKSVFTKGAQITGITLEGVFESVFSGRTAPTDSAAPNPPTAKFGARSGIPGKMVVISDGEFVLGKHFRGKRGYMPPDNKAIVMNAIDFLIGEGAITQIRSKDVVIRRLNADKAIKNAWTIRILNILLPVLLIVGFGLIRGFMRRKRNEQLQSA